ncbi:MAG: hypothetical protein E3K38_13575 [Candidatus Kuenenia stuttgartiensis]|nr:hypothetical protein [Candidatus Kuenenia stuttgartiensis]
MRDVVLIITSPEEAISVDPVMSIIREKYDELSVLRVNLDSFLKDRSTVSLWMEGKISGWQIEVQQFDNKGTIFVNESNIKSIWYRRASSPKSPNEVADTYKEFIENEARKTFSSLWSIASNEISWLNHPDHSFPLEFNKPRQMKVASEIGLKIPSTLITNNPREAVDCLRKWNGQGIIKVFGGSTVRSKSGGTLISYTKEVNIEDVFRLSAEVEFCPIFLQENVPKSFELRITIVGKKIFPCAIYSQSSARTKTDWRRFDFDNVPHVIHKLPPEINDQLLRLMDKLNLNFGAIDMIVTPTGTYVFLEVNPSGQWGWIEHITKMPISQAIADFLCRGKT